MTCDTSGRARPSGLERTAQGGRVGSLAKRHDVLQQRIERHRRCLTRGGVAGLHALLSWQPSMDRRIDAAASQTALESWRRPACPTDRDRFPDRAGWFPASGCTSGSSGSPRGSRQRSTAIAPDNMADAECTAGTNAMMTRTSPPPSASLTRSSATSMSDLAARRSVAGSGV